MQDHKERSSWIIAVQQMFNVTNLEEKVVLQEEAWKSGGN